ncbi:MAG: hypothetical protein ACK40X_09730, partial [Armatimonadota bacterium]
IFVREALKQQGGQTHAGNDNAACREFCNMQHIRALFNMLDWEKARNLPVQYPPGGSDPNATQYWEAFRWFTHPNQRNFFRRPRHMLLTPEEIVQGSRQDGFPPRNLSQLRPPQQIHHQPSQRRRSR